MPTQNLCLPTKFCNSCHQTKDKSLFKRQYKHNAKGEKRPNGWSYVCKSCLSFMQVEEHRMKHGYPTIYTGDKGRELGEIESNLRFATKQKNLKLLDQLQDKLIALCVESPDNPAFTGLLLIAFLVKEQNFSCSLCRGPLPLKPRIDYWSATKKIRGLFCVGCKNQAILLYKDHPIEEERFARRLINWQNGKSYEELDTPLKEQS